MLSTIADRIHPMVPGIDVRILRSQEDPALGYYLIDVPHSVSAPHCVRHQSPETHWSCYPLRHGSATIYLSEAQVAARYRDRFELARRQVDRLARLHAGAAVAQPTKMTLAIGVVPAISGHRPLTGDGPVIRTYFDAVWKEGGSRISPRFGTFQVARGRLRSTSSALDVELHTDGSAWASMSIGRVSPENIHVLDMDEFERTAVELTAMVGGYTAWAGSAGDCAVGAWLDPGSRQLGIRGNPTNLSVRPIAAETTAPVGALGGDRIQVGQVVYPLVRDLEQDMGIEEPDLLQPGGSFGRPTT